GEIPASRSITRRAAGKGKEGLGTPAAAAPPPCRGESVSRLNKGAAQSTEALGGTLPLPSRRPGRGARGAERALGRLSRRAGSRAAVRGDRGQLVADAPRAGPPVERAPHDRRAPAGRAAERRHALLRELG